MKNKILILLLLGLIVATSSCKTKEVPGRRRTPRHCNSCTKWTYMPKDESKDALVFSSMSYQPTEEGTYLWTEDFGTTYLQN